VFLVNSRSPLLSYIARHISVRVPAQHPISQSYGTILPSSFPFLLSSALVCSTNPPVSDSVRCPEHVHAGGQLRHPAGADRSAVGSPIELNEGKIFNVSEPLSRYIKKFCSLPPTTYHLTDTPARTPSYQYQPLRIFQISSRRPRSCH